MWTTLVREPSAQYCTAPTSPCRELWRQPCFPFRGFALAEPSIFFALRFCVFASASANFLSVQSTVDHDGCCSVGSLRLATACRRARLAASADCFSFAAWRALAWPANSAVSKEGASPEPASSAPPFVAMPSSPSPSLGRLPSEETESVSKGLSSCTRSTSC